LHRHKPSNWHAGAEVGGNGCSIRLPLNRPGIPGIRSFLQKPDINFCRPFAVVQASAALTEALVRQGEREIALLMNLVSTACLSWPILPILVFLAETCVVTLSTVRTILLARGVKGLAALLGFFEVSIWLFAVAQVMQNLNHLDCALAFASG